MLQNVNVLLMGASQGLHGGIWAGTALLLSCRPGAVQEKEHSPGPSRMLSSDAGRMICYVRAVGLVPGKDSSFLFPGAKLLPKFRGLLLF